jgi:uncharacterized protein YggE
MKKIIIIAITLFFAGHLIAQPAFVNNPFPKTITVTGSAAMEITPDEIYVNVALQEYQKKGDSKKDLETIKSQFLESCKAVGIADADISIIAYSGSNNNYYYMHKKKKNPDMMAGITYQVKFSNSKLMDELVDKLDDNATQNFSIESVSHSKITAFRKELKIKAVQAAKDKGLYLTEGIGEKLGEAITINEPEDNANSDNNIRIRTGMGIYSNSVSNERYKEAGMNGGDATAVDFKKMKLRYEVSVVFALK